MKSPSQRRLWKGANSRPRCVARSASAAASAPDRVTGLSTTTCLPALSARRANAKWVSLGVAMTMPSMSLRARSVCAVAITATALRPLWAITGAWKVEPAKPYPIKPSCNTSDMDALPFRKNALDFFDELGFQTHLAETVDLAIDVVVALDQADVFDLGADLDDAATALELEILDHGDGVAILQDIAGSVAPYLGAVFGRFDRLCRPFMRAFRADVERAVFISKCGLALRAGGQGTHDGFRNDADCRVRSIPCRYTSAAILCLLG